MKNLKKQKKLFKLVFEEFEPSTANPLYATAPEETMQPQNISLDQKVDHFLMQYEKESMPQNTVSPGLDLQTQMQEARSLFSMMFEADEPAPDADAPPADAGADLGADIGGGAPPAGDEESAAPIPSPKININNFASRLARLVSNYEALLDPKTTILGRAQTYIAKNYNDNVAKELMVVLETQFDLTIQTPADQKQNAVAPMAVGAAGDMIGAGGA